MIICSFAFFEVIFNLIDIPLFIEHGWIPVKSTSNATLTEDLLATLDVVGGNRTNRTDLAVRTPIIRSGKSNSKLKNVSGRK